ncbi:MAG: hypothetical protein ACRC6I_19130 [Paracoccaceae bacterium]
MLESYAYLLQNETDLVRLLLVCAAIGVGIALFLRRKSQLTITRGNDAYGHTRNTWFGIVPPISSEFAFRPSRRPASRSAGVNLLLGLNVIAAVAIFGATGVVGNKWTQMIGEQAATAVPAPALEAQAIDGFIRDIGLEAALQHAKATVVPQKIDNLTAIISADATADTLTINYLLDPSISTVPVQVRQELVQHHCGQALLRGYLDAGATFAFLYVHPAGDRVGHISIVARDCMI